jgi:hypothetical protein
MGTERILLGDPLLTPAARDAPGKLRARDALIARVPVVEATVDDDRAGAAAPP